MADIKKLEEAIKEHVKRYNAIHRDIKVVKKRLKYIDALFKEIGGQITEEEAKVLILKKLHDLINDQLTRYLNREKRGLVYGFDSLFRKYAVSSNKLKAEKNITTDFLDNYLSQLRYI